MLRLAPNIFLSLILLLLATGCSDILWIAPADLNSGIHTQTASPVSRKATPSTSAASKLQHTSEIVGLYALSAQEQFDRKNNFDIISIEQTGLVLGWNIEQGVAQEVYRSGDTINASAYFAKDSYLALAQKGGVSIINLNNGEIKFEERFHSRLQSLTFSPDGRSLLGSSADGNVFRWRWNPKQALEDGRDFERYNGHASVVSAVAYHPYGRVIFSADWNGVISAWLSYDSDIYSGEYDKNTFSDLFFSEKTRRQKGQVSGGKAVDHLRISPDGKWMLVGLQEGQLELWEVRGLRKTVSIDAHHGIIYDVALDSSGKLVASAGRDQKVRIWKIDGSDPDNASIAQLREFTLKDCIKLAFSEARAGKTPVLYAGQRDGTVLVLDLDSRASI